MKRSNKPKARPLLAELNVSEYAIVVLFTVFAILTLLPALLF